MIRDPRKLGEDSGREDRRDGYVPNGSVHIDSLANDAFSQHIQDDELRGTDREWREFLEGYRIGQGVE